MIYNNIKKICDSKGISIAAIEKEAGLANGTIRRWNDSSPTIGSLQAVAKVLHKKVDELIK